MNRTRRFLAGLSLLAACGEAAPEPAPPLAAVAAPPLEACNLPPDSIRMLVVLDHSGSMRPFWSEVQQSLPQMVSALPDGSWFSLQLFSRASVTQIPDVQLSPTTRPLVMQQLRSLAMPASGAPTDVGLALRGAAMDIEAAAADGRGALTFLFVVSDGKHQPGAGSPFPTTGAFTPLVDSWRDLESRARVRLFAYAVPIGADGLEGAADFERVIPRTKVLLPMQPTQVGSAVTGEVRTAMANLILAQTAPEVAEPRLTARLAEPDHPVAYRGDTHTTAVVRSSAGCVTYAFAGTVAGDTTAFMLAPGDSAVVPVRLRSDLGLLAALPWRTHETREAGVQLAGTLAFAPADQLLAAGVDTTHQALTLPVAGTVVPQPMTWATFLTPVAAAALLLLLAGLHFGRPPKLWGTVRHGGGATDLGELGAGTHDVVLPGGARVRFRARKRNPFGLDGYDSHVAIEVVEAIRVEVHADEEVLTVTRGRRIRLSPDCTIRVVSGEGAEPSTLTWN